MEHWHEEATSYQEDWSQSGLCEWRWPSLNPGNTFHLHVLWSPWAAQQGSVLHLWVSDHPVSHGEGSQEKQMWIKICNPFSLMWLVSTFMGVEWGTEDTAHVERRLTSDPDIHIHGWAHQKFTSTHQVNHDVVWNWNIDQNAALLFSSRLIREHNGLLAVASAFFLTDRSYLSWKLALLWWRSYQENGEWQEWSLGWSGDRQLLLFCFF